jgi:hypothetical protein
VSAVLKWTAGIAVIAVAIVYLADSLSVRRRVAHKTAADPLETMNIRPIYAVPRKDGKSEFDFGDSQSQTCVHSIFPHLGYNPCWYLLRESRKPIPIGSIFPYSPPAPYPAATKLLSFMKDSDRPLSVILGIRSVPAKA